jgi:ribosome biogenesis GTPase
MKGIVIKSTGSWYKVKGEDGEIYDCRIKGKFRIKGIRTTNPLAVGDRIHFHIQEGNDIPVIDKIEPRQNYIVRKSVNLSKEAHILAANIDQALLFVTLAYPETTLSFIDRFLITAEAYKIPTTLVFNKVDLYDEEQLLDLDAYKMMYNALGYDSIVCSAKEGIGLEALHSKLKDKTTLVAGHSGVGKSTLINSIEPTVQIKTNEISDIHLQGKHTTTFAEMHELNIGGNIIDTPGIRGFGLVYFNKEEIRDLFLEFKPLAEDCKFSNCMHIKEPKCAVKDAVENDELFATRYENYLQFINDLEEEEINPSYR